MLFNSFQFIVFFTACLAVYYLLPHRARWMFLLAASVVFYMAWNPPLILLIVCSCVFNHISAHYINRTDGDKKRKRALVFALIINFGLLFVFKYLMFISGTFAYLFGLMNITYSVPEFSIILPVGISFYTFQAVGYVIDVYRREIEPERNVFRFTLFITFFPQLIAGPIERADQLLPQFFKRVKFDVQNITDGAKYVLLGFFKKVVIADRAAVIVNAVYNSPRQHEGLPLIIATVLFAFQIYCDFAGYSEIARGCAKMLGIDLTANFKSPYMARSIREFWARWHISLSRWFRDYLYIPMGGSRVPAARGYLNLMFTFLVSGMWHGANWTFLIWGFAHGLFQSAGKLTQPLRGKFMRFLRLENFFLTNILRALFCFVLVTVAWVFFRANTAGDAFYILRHMFIHMEANAAYVFNAVTAVAPNVFELTILACMIVFLLVVDFFAKNADIHARLNRAPFMCRFAFYYVQAAFVMAAGVFDSAGQFIYFQF